MTAPSAPPGAVRPPTGRASARGARTRERLLDAAERLWGERGVEGVSLREVRLAAGQRNTSALHFHFGGRDGLLAALADRHLPRVAALQGRLDAEVAASGRQDDLAALVEVLVRPYADYLRQGPSERAWVKVCAGLAGRPDVAMADAIGAAPPIALRVGATLHERLAVTLGTTLAVERLVAVSTATLHLCADRARAEDATTTAAAPMRPLLAFEAWRDNLLDMAAAATTAPARAPRR